MENKEDDESAIPYNGRDFLDLIIFMKNLLRHFEESRTRYDLSILLIQRFMDLNYRQISNLLKANLARVLGLQVNKSQEQVCTVIVIC